MRSAITAPLMFHAAYSFCLLPRAISDFFDSLLMRRGTQHHLMEGSNNYGASICLETRRNILCGPALNSFFSTPARKILRN